jgi:hypothetical protein
VDLTDLRLEVRERLGELTADFYTSDEVDRAINEAVRRFCAEEPWPFLLTEWTSTLSANANELALPTDISLTRVFNIAVDGDSLSTPRMLVRVDPNEGFALRHQYTNSTGTPRWYYISRSNQSDDEAPPVTYTAKVIPTPDAAYDVEGQYMCIPNLLTLTSEEPMVPYEYQEAIAAWATGKLFLKEHQISQKASEQFGLYAKVLEQARKDLKSFSLDEVVAWGRRHPLRGQLSATDDPRFRTPQNLG